MAISVLWFSRHDMTKEQIEDLERIYGDINIVKFDKTIKDFEEILSVGKFDVYAVVLPANLIARLMKICPENVQIIQPVSERVITENKIINPATQKEESEYEFRHVCWQRIVKAVFEVETL